MAKNYQQAGLTIPVTNSTNEVIKSGAPVVLGDLIVIAITDIAKRLKNDYSRCPDMWQRKHSWLLSK